MSGEGDEKDEGINKHSRLENKVFLERLDMNWFKSQNNSQSALQKVGVFLGYCWGGWG